MKKITISTLGCKVNQFESAAFATTFAEAGHSLAPSRGAADIHVINTCAVTARAAQQSRQMIRRARRENPHALIVITGCLAQTEAETLARICAPPLLLVGNGGKQELARLALAGETDSPQLAVSPIRTEKTICDLPVGTFPDRTRAYLRIQDGCDNFCSYCIVPHSRGPSRSLPLSAVLRQAERFAGQGCRELVITGINVGKYGLDLAEGEDIYSLLARLCRSFPAIRIRLSSIEPTEVNAHLLELAASQANFMPHLHIPLQSGDDNVLARMRRTYTRDFFAGIIEKIHRILPGLTIGCDVLAGFPGETEQAAENTYALLAGLPLSYLHVFPYSRRAGTRAAAMDGQVPEQDKQARARRLRGLDDELRQQWRQRCVGTTQQVLFERRHPKGGLLQGLAENYLPVLCPGPAQLLRTVVAVRVEEAGTEQARGVLLEKAELVDAPER